MKGAEYEEVASEYLKGLGYRILGRNYQCRSGEIDIVALDGDTLVFVEVKGGISSEFGHPVERFDKRKLSRIVECAYSFMEREGLGLPFRVDLIVIFNGEIEHHRNVGFD